MPRTAFHSWSTLQRCSRKLDYSQASLQDFFHILQECRAGPSPSTANVGSRTNDSSVNGSQSKGDDDFSALDDLPLHYSSPALAPPPAPRGFWETAVGRSFEKKNVAWSWTGDSSTNVDHGERGGVDVTAEIKGACKLTRDRKQSGVIEVNGGAHKQGKGLLATHNSAPPKMYTEDVEILDTQRQTEARLERKAVVGSCQGGEGCQKAWVDRNDDCGGRQGLREDEKRILVGGVSRTSPKDAAADGPVKPPSSEGDVANGKLAQGTGTHAVRNLIQWGGRVGEGGMSCEVARHEGAMVIGENRRPETDESRSTGEYVQTKTRSSKKDVVCVCLQTIKDVVLSRSYPPYLVPFQYSK